LVDNTDKRRFSVTLTRPYIEALDRLVEEGLYIDHQDAIRHALRRLFQYHGMELFLEKVGSETDSPPEP